MVACNDTELLYISHEQTVYGEELEERDSKYMSKINSSFISH